MTGWGPEGGTTRLEDLRRAWTKTPVQEFVFGRVDPIDRRGSSEVRVTTYVYSLGSPDVRGVFVEGTVRTRHESVAIIVTRPLSYRDTLSSQET